MKRITPQAWPLLLLLASALLMTRDAAGGPGPAACCAMSTSRVDSIINPVLGGDEKIFTRVSGPPTVVFLIGNNTSMQDFVSRIPDGTVNDCQAGDSFWSLYNSTGGGAVFDPDTD